MGELTMHAPLYQDKYMPGMANKMYLIFRWLSDLVKPDVKFDSSFEIWK